MIFLWFGDRAGYCAHWAAKLDPVPSRAIVSAAAAAQKAADYILGVKFGNENADEG